MIVTGLDVIATARSMSGLPYCQINPDRYLPDSLCHDCSGLGVAALLANGVEVHATVSMTLEAEFIARGGKYLSREEASTTPAAACFIVGWGNQGHFGLMIGDGLHTIETPSAQGRFVGISPIDHDEWERYTTIPGVDHKGGGAPDLRATALLLFDS